MKPLPAFEVLVGRGQGLSRWWLPRGNLASLLPPKEGRAGGFCSLSELHHWLSGLEVSFEKSSHTPIVLVLLSVMLCFYSQVFFAQ